MIPRMIGSEAWRNSRAPDLWERDGDRDTLLERSASQADEVRFGFR